MGIVKVPTRDGDLVPIGPLPSAELSAESPHASETRPYADLGANRKIAIISLIVTFNLVQFISTFSTMGGGLALSEALGRDISSGQPNWMAASYPLTQGACVLVTGRLGTVYGHQRLTLIGGLIFAICSLGNAFCTTYDAFVVVRALSGVGGGIFMPNCVAVLMLMIPPGRWRNITMGFFAASPPLGGTLGGLLVGIFTQYTHWRWLFVMIAGLSAAILLPLALLSPTDIRLDPKGKIDYVGTFLGLSSLLIFNVVWNQAPAVGWSTPYEIALLIVSVVLFMGFLLWEHKYATEPIMPLKVFRAPSFTALIFVVLLSYMAFGISLWYGILWQQTFRGATVLDVGIRFIPFGVASVLAVFMCAWMIPRFAAQWIMAIGMFVCLASNILIATMPREQTYWAQVFPSYVFGGFCPDLVYVAAQVIASNSVSRKHQGAASSLIGTLNLYGTSLGLGFAGTIESEVKRHYNELLAFRASVCFGAGLAVIGLVLDFAFVRVPKDKREGWDDTSSEHDA